MSTAVPLSYRSFGPTFDAAAIARFARTQWAGGGRPTGHAPILVVVPTGTHCEQLAPQLEFLLRGIDPQTGAYAERLAAANPVTVFPSWEVLPFDVLSPAAEASAKRMKTLSCALMSRAELVIAPVDALMQKIVPRAVLTGAVGKLKIGDEVAREALLELFDYSGYVRSTVVEEIGEFAVRGALVDFFPPGVSDPVRAEFFGDQLESLRHFDAATQRSKSPLSEIDVIPVREFLWRPGSSSDRRYSLPDSTVQKLRMRASELALPQSEAKEIEEALRQYLPWPGIEHLQPLVCDGLEGLWDYLGDQVQVVICDRISVSAEAEKYQEVIAERAEQAEREGRMFPAPGEAYFEAAVVEQLISDFGRLYLDRLNITRLEEWDAEDAPQPGALPQEEEAPSEITPNTKLDARLRAARQRELPFAPLAEEIKQKLEDGFSVAIVVHHHQRGKRIVELLEPYGISAAEFKGSFAQWQLYCRENRRHPTVCVIDGRLDDGFLLQDERLLVISDRELFPDISARQPADSGQRARRFLTTLAQLKENDYAVHIDYGIGLYRGLAQKTIDGKVGDFLVLEYAEGSKLFLPVENIGRIQKYRGVEGVEPALSRLGAKTWDSAKRKVEENVAELAGKLLEIMAQREVASGYNYPAIDSDDVEFAASFPYDETPDQSAAIEAVLSDMSAAKPMDRLVCGDVGYGKTEVAVRAAFKAANAGKQVALLVPTTILADQHFSTFQERFSQSAITIGCLSRFYSAAENRKTLAGLAEGNVDIVIGTHRLLQRDVVFRDLGLVIIDEEHRFGVAHKERLKRLRATVDVLTLTATPIPRTLHMSLSGIKDLSVIETPPTNRQVIRTYIAPNDASVIREAVMRELGRGGQVFYVNNRVKNIGAVAEELSELVPQAKIGIGHGQMPERELEDVMHRFISREFDVLVCTTIVESGLDIPNANTIVIREADKFGLAELYQLRGRVGRSSRRAYAYLLVADPKSLRSEARRRLQVLQSLDDLGIGFRLALQDMEIRGAGNLLGKSQSGHISSIGYELYSQILQRAVEQLRARKLREAGAARREVPQVDPEVRIGFPAHIPPEYIPDVAERLLLYQRLIDLRDEQHGLEFAEEIEDRFGKSPPEVAELIELMIFRSLLRRAGIVRANYRDDVLSIGFHPEMKLETAKLLALAAESDGVLAIKANHTLRYRIAADAVSSPADLTKPLRQLLAKIVPDWPETETDAAVAQGPMPGVA